METAMSFTMIMNNETLKHLKSKELDSILNDLRQEYLVSAKQVDSHDTINEFKNLKARFVQIDKSNFIFIIEMNEPDDIEGYYFLGIGITQKEGETDVEKIFLTLEKHESNFGYIIAWSENMQGSFCGSIKPDLWRFVKYIKGCLLDIDAEEFYCF